MGRPLKYQQDAANLWRVINYFQKPIRVPIFSYFDKLFIGESTVYPNNLIYLV